MSNKIKYVELHAASSFSFLEGASNPERLIDRAIELGLPSIAITDRNGVYGAARFHTRAQAVNKAGNNIQAHIGAEISTEVFATRTLPPAYLPHRVPAEPSRLTLLCATRMGYQNLCQLITTYKLRAPGKQEGAATLEDLAQYAEGLVCLTGGDEGPLASALTRGGEREGSRLLEQLVALYGRENVYVELQRHHERNEEWRNQAAVRLAIKHRLPLLATNGVRYATAPGRQLLDVFTSIRRHVELEQAGRLLARNSERHLRSAAEMHALFRDLPSALDHTVELASRLTFRLDDLGYKFPLYPVPEGETMASFLRKRVDEGVRQRYAAQQDKSILAKAFKQVQTELALIEQLGFEGYFLIVWNIVTFCKSNDILIQGRGSAANSVVCYVLEITAVNPLMEGKELLFERFLSESRGEWPDIDLDLPSGDKREQAIQYVYQRYGELGAAMTANVITYRGRSAAREVGKVLGFDEETLNRLSSLVGHWEWKAKTDTMPNQFSQAGFDLNHPRIAKYLELCLALQDLPRHLGQHSGGMVICQGLLNKVVPLERASMPGRTVVQWDKEDCADMGLIKVDLLGLGMMAVMKDCVELVGKHYGKHYNLGALPQDVPEVYQALCRADTVGMFQVESRAQMASLPRNMPKEFYDIVVQVAIIRPGPIVGKMMHPYMRRRQGKEKVTYPHPSLEPVLKRTLGVPLFQEQLLRMAMTVANFTGAEAEELRRAIGMRRSQERMRELVVKLRAGMSANGISLEVQDNIVQSVSSFALYGFPESHAASFALIAYASAYFKVRYLAAFTCAILNNQPMGFYMPAVLVKDAQRHGLRVRPIDVQRSRWPCTLEREPDGSLSLRMGLMYAKGLRAQAAQALVEERERGGLFANVDDLEERLQATKKAGGAAGLTRPELVQLARIGALNSLGEVAHRRDALWQVEQAGRPAGPLLSGAAAASQPGAKRTRRLADDAPGGGQSAGEISMRDESQDEPLSPLAQMSTEERLVADFGGTGLTTGPHPMAYKRAELRRERILSSAELAQAANGSYVRTAGCVIARQRPGTASGFIFLSLEDESGIANIIIHPELYERQRLLVMGGKFLLVEGRLQNEDRVVHVRAEHVAPLSMARIETRSHDFH
jgi:error-prone DNA polymerase